MIPSLEQYRTHYRIPRTITEQEMLSHWNCERQMRQALLNSSPESRAAVFEQCYTTLYTRFPWLNEAPPRPASEFRSWHSIIGAPKQNIFEVGSGKGELIDSLAALGHQCTATEITSQRGARSSSTGVRWISSDGIHLEVGQSSGCYDVVISNQVIEHLHPDDLDVHFITARKILRPKGRYIFATPHTYVGPSDVSALFGCRNPEGMHLKEHTYMELASRCKKAGFKRLESVLRLPSPLNRLFSARASVLYMKHQVVMEMLIGHAPIAVRRRCASFGKVALFAPTIFMVAHNA